jgi:NAD-dependent deacetylase
VPEVIERAMRAAAEAELFLSVGTSLQVFPVAGTVPAAKQSGARVVIVNAEPTPFDALADAVFHGAIGETLPRIVGAADTIT